jgi:hypothetical protein
MHQNFILLFLFYFYTLVILIYKSCVFSMRILICIPFSSKRKMRPLASASKRCIRILLLPRSVAKCKAQIFCTVFDAQVWPIIYTNYMDSECINGIVAFVLQISFVLYVLIEILWIYYLYLIIKAVRFLSSTTFFRPFYPPPNIKLPLIPLVSYVPVWF